MTSRGPWVPRVLKKRATEFNVDSADAPAAAPPPPVAEFKGAADLDELEEAEPAAKKIKSEPSAAAAGSSDGPAAQTIKSEPSDAAAGSAPAAPPAEPKDEIIEAAPKLAQHIANPSKFNKVAAMAWTLLDTGRVTSRNGGAFFEVLRAGMRDPKRLREKPYRVGYKKLYSAAIASAHLFPPEAQPTLKLWEVHVIAHIDLHTDDSYQFSRAAKQVRESLQRLPCVYPSLDVPGVKHFPEEERDEWVAAFFDCIEAAMSHHKYSWAKTTCDLLVKDIVDRRQNFNEAQQRTIQEWNLRCKGQKVQRQQEHARQQREMTSYERKEAEWRSAEISISSKACAAWAHRTP